MKFSLPLFIKEKRGFQRICATIGGSEELFLRVTGGKKLDRRNIRSDGAILAGLYKDPIFRGSGGFNQRYIKVNRSGSRSESIPVWYNIIIMILDRES